MFFLAALLLPYAVFVQRSISPQFLYLAPLPFTVVSPSCCCCSFCCCCRCLVFMFMFVFLFCCCLQLGLSRALAVAQCREMQVKTTVTLPMQVNKQHACCSRQRSCGVKVLPVSLRARVRFFFVFAWHSYHSLA